MKYLIIVILAMSSCVSSYHHLEHVSGYDIKTIHEVKPYKHSEEKGDFDLEAKLEVLSKMLKEHQQGQQKTRQQTRKTDVSFKTDLQAEVEKEVDIKEEEYSVPNYEFGYGVKDFKTGDNKDQWEKRVGGKVKGVYKFDESDGTQRVVEYEADDKKGFEAKVKNVEKVETVEEAKGKTKDSSLLAHSYSFLKQNVR